jgi:3-methyladenine DNA glycosylase/8-oxoguanine DNA glycosylase
LDETAIRGVGRWTVKMLLIFGLGRQDVLSVSFACGTRSMREARQPRSDAARGPLRAI